MADRNRALWSSFVVTRPGGNLFSRLGASRAIAIHWGTYRLRYEARDTPPKLLDAVMKCRTDINGGRLFTAVTPGAPTEIGRMLPGGQPAKPVTRDAVVLRLDTPLVRALC